MLARIRVGDRRFIAAASGPREARSPCCARTPGVLRDLDLAARLFVQVSIQTRQRPLGFCAHHYDTSFAALVVRGCDHASHIGDLKAPVDRNPSSARTKK